jgi:hypothetical protein
VPVYHPFGAGGREITSFLFTGLGDALGVVTVILLLIALRRFAPRGRWGRPLLPALLVAGVLASWVVWQSLMDEKFYHANQLAAAAGELPTSVWGWTYPTIGYSAVGFIVAIVAVVYALGISDQVLGGGLLAGWAAIAFALFLVYVTSPNSYSGWAVAVAALAGALIVATGILAIVYARRKQPA